MSRRFDGFQGTLTALGLFLTLWLIGIGISLNREKLVPRQWFLSDNRFVGWGSPVEEVCRKVPAVHQYLWPLPNFL